MKFFTWFMVAVVAAAVVTAYGGDEYAYQKVAVRIITFWDDNSNSAGLRPDTLTYTIVGSYEGATPFSTNVVVACPSGTNSFETMVDGLPDMCELTNLWGIYEYTLTEPSLPEFYKPVIVSKNDLSLTLSVNGDYNARIGEGGELVFEAIVFGYRPGVSNVVWSYVIGDTRYQKTTEVSPYGGLGRATLKLAYSDLAGCTQDTDYIMTATCKGEGVEDTARVQFGILGDNPAIIFTEPMFEVNLAVEEACAFKVQTFKRASTDLTISWSCSDPSKLAPGYSVPAADTSEFYLAFKEAGDYSVTATVTDTEDNSKTGSATVRVHVGEKVVDRYVFVVTNSITAVVKNVTARQRWPWNGLVDVDYDVLGNTDGMKAEIEFNEDGGGGRSWKATKFLPGCEPSAAPGHHRATWTAPEDTRAKVKATVRLVRKVLKD